MSRDKIIKALREFHDDGPDCPLHWEPHYRNKDGYEVRFDHECGDGCCSWSEHYFIDKGHGLWDELSPLFALYPIGEDYPDREDSEQDDF